VRRRLLAPLAATALAVPGIAVVAPAVFASSVTSASLTGDAATRTVGGVLWAKEGAVLTLKVVSSNDTTCVGVTGAQVLPVQTAPTGQTDWTFTVRAPAGNGAQAFTVTASPQSTSSGCSGQSTSTQVSYMLDNVGPNAVAQLSPAPNAANWNNSNVTVTWTSVDGGIGGIGVPGPQPFQTDTVTSEGVIPVTTPYPVDLLGNLGSGGLTIVRLDKTPPTITAAQAPNADGTTTITFTCADPAPGAGAAPSGIATCPSPRVVGPGVTVSGTATDLAGNTKTATSTAPPDATPPTLTGAPTTRPNDSGWYTGDVVIHWTAADPESGIPNPPADTTITGEGTGLTSTVTVTNGSRLSTTATSPAVKIDRTAPTTGLAGTSNDWVQGDVTVSLTPTDNLSGVASTSYAVDGGTTQSGTTVTLSTEGDHTLTYFSTDTAGNVERAQSAHIKIDKTAPAIRHTFTPSSYRDGTWANVDVTVTFVCTDQGGSGIASCTSPVTKTTEGEGQTVAGTATDNAGNSATDSAVVSIDKTPPTITATPDRKPNTAGWYGDDVRVAFRASDVLSGVTSVTPDTVLHEGADQSATGTATDAAGNAASAGVRGINIDTTAPVLSASFSSGWHTSDVLVTWSCTDALSGVATGPANDTVTGEGANLSSTASCTDKAGNTATKTVSGIQIDRTPPTTASVPPLPAGGWYDGTLRVTLNADDNLSGVAATYYRVDGGATQAYQGPFGFDTDGTHSVTFWSEDKAGNVEVAGPPLTVRVDRTAPTTKVVNPVSPAGGWFVSGGIPFAFDASDAGSGVAATYYAIDGGPANTYGQPFTADISNGGHTVTYWSVDAVGNVEPTQALTLKIDSVGPTITGKQSPAPNAYGWNNTSVDVTFTCTDDGPGASGVAGCSGSTTLANEGAGQKVHGDAVDLAGNRSALDYGPVNIDMTSPTLVGVPDGPNAAGWYKSDVRVKWVGDDALSGIDPATQPADSTITGEGSDLGAGPVTVEDKAGNTSDKASVTGIKIDRTAPVISGGPTTQPNAAGWYKDSVTVDFTCSDLALADGSDGSGVASCPTSKLIKGDGANQSVTSDSATDVAGNASAGKTVGGINIDGTAPSTTSNNQCTSTNGYCTGSTANVVLTATDQTGLSGVKEIHYSIDGGAEQVSAGATKTVSIPLDGSGAGTVKYWAVDNAGNVESANTVSLKWDNIAPAVTHTLSPVPNADDWNNSNVTVTFTAKDDDAGSGVASVTAPVTVSTETASQLINGTATDTAGNVGTDTVTVKLDKTAPSISGAIVSGTKGSNGWYVGPVTVHFTCADALSGIPGTACPSDVTVSANGANQSVTRSVTDRAGNSASATVSGISIDREKPTLTTADVNVQGGTSTMGSVPAATCTATDGVSGLASCAVKVTATASGVGTFTYTATATDKAGNTTTVTGTFTVIYRFDGFLQPINDTAHQVGTSTSVFKAGSAVPVKFQLSNSAGTVVQASTAPTWLTPVMGSAMTAPINEPFFPYAADTGTTYRYDSSAQQYIYNWKTAIGGTYWRIGVTLDDGRTYYANVGLR
jgi:hypothetical protein